MFLKSKTSVSGFVLVDPDDQLRSIGRRGFAVYQSRARRKRIASLIVFGASAMVVASAAERFGWGVLGAAVVLLAILAIARWGFAR